MPHEDPETRSYSLNPGRRIPLTVMFSLFVLGGAALPFFGKPEDRIFLLGMGAVLALFGAGFYWMISRTRLYVSPSSVKALFLWLTLETPWSNIESLRLDRGQEAFITAAPMEGSGPRQMATNGGGPAYDAAAAQWITLRRYIPLEGFTWQLRRGLGEDIRRFAPHLQAALDAGPPPPPPPAPAQQKVKWPLLILIIVLLIGSITLTFTAPQMMYKARNIAYLVLTPLISLQCAWSAVKAFRRKQILSGIFASLFAIICALFTLAIIGTMIEPEKTGPGKAKTPAPAPAPGAAASRER